MIGDALKRKKVSDQYHSKVYPYFMHANGPYKIYDHAQKVGAKEYQKMQSNNEQAVSRFNEELQQIKNLKEFQKTEFA